MGSNPRRRWYQVSVLNMLALVTIAAIVPVAVYAWRQRQQTAEAIALSNLNQAKCDKAEEVANILQLENKMLSHFLGVEVMTKAEYNSVWKMVEDSPRLQAIVKQYEDLLDAAETGAGQPLPPDSRDYPSIALLLSQQVQAREKALLETKEMSRVMQEDRDRLKQEADIYKAQCELLQKAAEERGDR